MANNPNQATADSIALIIKRRRKNLKLTQAQLADLAGVSGTFVFDLENGKPTVSLDKTQAVAGALGLELRLEVADLD